jgi:F-type H+-transporting ATPase subunit c
MKKSNLAIVGAALLPVLAHAEEAAKQAASKPDAAYWAAGLCVGVAAAVAAFSQSRAASAAFEGIGRNPAAAKPMFLPMLLALALMESLVLFAFLVAGNLLK